MTSARRYAEGTQVPVSRSHDQIKAELRRVGADQIGVMEGGGMAYVVFKVNDVLYRIASVPIDPKSKRDPEAEQRRQWRAITLLVKAKVVSITEKISTVEREFLSDAVMPDGTTLADHAPKLISDAYAGRPPKILMLGAE